MNAVEPRDGRPVRAIGCAVLIDLQDCGRAARIFQHPDESTDGWPLPALRDQRREIERVAFGQIECPAIALVVIEDAIEDADPGWAGVSAVQIEQERVGTGTSGNVSLPARPLSTSAPKPPTSALIPPLPVRVSASALPVMFSMPLSASPCASPPEPEPVQQAHGHSRGGRRVICRVRFPRRHSARRRPKPPTSVLAPLSPVSTSASALPMMFSMPLSVSPCASPPEPSPVAGSRHCTAADDE